MSETLKDVRAALAEGKCLVAVCSDEAFGLVQSFTDSDPTPGAAGRPVFYWDHLDGLSATGGASVPPNTEEVMNALDYAGTFKKPALFVFNLDQVGVAEAETTFRRALRNMAGHFIPSEQRALVVVTTEPLPERIAALFARLGYPAARSAVGTRARTGPAWHEMAQLEKFDTAAWRERLEHLTEQDMAEIASGGFHGEAVRRVRDLRDALKRLYARRDDVIDLMTYATIAQVPMVLLGPPGTAKSHLIRSFCEGLGLVSTGRKPAESTPGDEGGNGKSTAGFFEYLFTRYTTPEEIFGPVHIQDLIERRLYRRVTTGRLPEAEVAFLDEIFKASSAIVNTLLAILNERIFHNADVIQRVPLVMIFAASNEPPQDAQLAALYDRFPIRATCGRVEDEHVNELWQRSWEMSFAKQFHPEGLTLSPISCTNDFRLLNRMALCQYGGRGTSSAGGPGHIDFNAEFLRIFRSLRRDYDISDRTLRHLYALARATALVERRPHLSVEELNVFRYVSWDETGAGELARLVNNLKRGVSL
jgi:MoxR-like ATPase